MRKVKKKKKEERKGLGMATMPKRGGGRDYFPSAIVVTAVVLPMIVGAASSDPTFYGKAKNNHNEG